MILGVPRSGVRGGWVSEKVRDAKSILAIPSDAKPWILMDRCIIIMFIFGTNNIKVFVHFIHSTSNVWFSTVIWTSLNSLVC